MARLQLEIPEHFIFETTIPIRVSDLNYGGHVGNDRILLLMQEARVIFYRKLGFKDEISFEGSVGQIITDAMVLFKSESFLGDEVTIRLAVTDFTKYGFDMLYLLENRVTGKEIARGKTGIVCFDYEKRKVSSIPQSLLQFLTPSGGA